MKINIVSQKLEVTESLKKFIEDKFSSLARLASALEKEGELNVFVEVSRITRHHKKGDVFYEEATAGVPGRTLRAEAISSDARTAVNKARDVLRIEIQKYMGSRTNKPRKSARAAEK